MKKIKNIEIVLENCDVIQVELDSTVNLILRDIQENSSIVNQNKWSTNKVANEAHLSFSDQTKMKYLQEYHSQTSPHDRLKKYKDITSICVNFDNKTDEQVYIWWEDGKNQFENKLQKIRYIKKWKTYHISIRRK